MNSYTPPYSLTDRAVSQIAQISEAIGKLSFVRADDALRLRRTNRIRTIQGSLAIEGNTLTEKQITAVLAGKPVIAPPREILEVRNALNAYEQMQSWEADSEKHLLAAHRLLMAGLIDTAGKYRQGAAGIMGSQGVIHVAPPADRVPYQIQDLLGWLSSTEAHPLVASSVFHYEFEFIHPFADGNGRMGRLWQTLILSGWNPIFADLPVESLVHAHQADYYKALNQSTEQGSCTPFIDFMLHIIHELVITTQETAQETTQEKRGARILGYLRQHPTASRNDISNALGDISPDGIKYQLAKLQKAGHLKRIGPTKGGHWQVVQKL